jgi:hypothetical protein
MVQFLSINFFSWISSIFVGFFESSRFFVSLCIMSVSLGYLACKVILPPVSCLAVPYSSHYLMYGIILGKKLIETFLNERGIE